MTSCDNCNGEGLVGQGAQPWLKQGKLETCPKCGGTGQVAEGTQQEEVTDEKVASQEQQPVDNSTSNLGDGSQESLGGEANQEKAPPAVE